MPRALRLHHVPLVLPCACLLGQPVGHCVAPTLRTRPVRVRMHPRELRGCGAPAHGHSEAPELAHGLRRAHLAPRDLARPPQRHSAVAVDAHRPVGRRHPQRLRDALDLAHVVCRPRSADGATAPPQRAPALIDFHGCPRRAPSCCTAIRAQHHRRLLLLLLNDRCKSAPLAPHAVIAHRRPHMDTCRSALACPCPRALPPHQFHRPCPLLTLCRVLCRPLGLLSPLLLQASLPLPCPLVTPLCLRTCLHRLPLVVAHKHHHPIVLVLTLRLSPCCLLAAAIALLHRGTAAAAAPHAHPGHPIRPPMRHPRSACTLQLRRLHCHAALPCLLHKLLAELSHFTGLALQRHLVQPGLCGLHRILLALLLLLATGLFFLSRTSLFHSCPLVMCHCTILRLPMPLVAGRPS